MTTIETATGTAQTMVLNMGPQHPSTHGVLRVVLELDGETVVKARPEIGYLHTGIEKSCEALTYSQAITLTDRIDYLAPLSNNLGYCLAVEKLLGLEVPKRAQYIRVLLTEMTRLNSHLVWLGTHAMDLGATSVMLYCFREREEILKIFEMVSGQRMMTSYFRIGGLALEPPPGWLDRVRRFIDMFPSRIEEYEELLTRNRIWLMRTQGIGILEAKDAIALGVSGPMLRAAGVAYDVRKFFPYSSYEEFDFDVPTRTESDCYARYLVRAGGNAREPENCPPGHGQNSARGADQGRRAGHCSAAARKDEDGDGSADLSLQDFHRGLCAAARRSLSAHRIAARRGGLLRCERRFAEALPREGARAFVRQSAGVAQACRRRPGGRPDRLHRNDRHRPRRSGPLMELPPVLEQKFQTLIARYPIKRSALVPMALYAQDALGYVSDELIAEIASRLDLNPLQVTETLAYYSMIRRKPAGKYHVQVCTNVSCMLRGGNEVYDFVQKKLEIGNKEVTADGMFSLEEVECIGACTGAPAMQVNYDFYENLDRAPHRSICWTLSTRAHGRANFERRLPAPCTSAIPPKCR